MQSIKCVCGRQVASQIANFIFATWQLTQDHQIQHLPPTETAIHRLVCSGLLRLENGLQTHAGLDITRQSPRSCKDNSRIRTLPQTKKEATQDKVRSIHQLMVVVLSSQTVAVTNTSEVFHFSQTPVIYKTSCFHGADSCDRVL